MPFEETSLSLPAVGETLGDTDGEPGINIGSQKVSVESDPEWSGVSFVNGLFAEHVQVVSVVESVSVRLTVHVHDSGSDVVEWQGDDSADDWGQEQSSGLDEIELAESNEPGFMEVVVRTSEWGVEGDVPDDVGEGSLVRGVFLLEGIESFRDATVVSSPFLSNLWVENLSNGHNSVRGGEIGSNTTGNTSDDGLFPWSQVIGGLDRFCLVVDEFIEGVSDGEISKSGDEVGLETLVEAGKAASQRVHLSEYFIGIVALIQGWI